jgi:hypothetical protein
MPNTDLDDLAGEILDDGELVSTPEPEREDPSDAALDRAGYRWALDVDWVYIHLGDKMTKAKCGTPARWALWKAAKEDPEKFVMTVVVKTMPLLEKARERTGDPDGVIVAEKKSIRELRALLKSAVEEAGAVQ